MNEAINHIFAQLQEPFHPTLVTWRVTSQNQVEAQADLRAYQNRLNEVCGLDWSVSYTPWGDRLICHITIKGVTRSSTGSTEHEAFVNASAMFGLGRYLQNLPSCPVEYDADTLQLTERATKRLTGIVNTHYQNYFKNQ